MAHNVQHLQPSFVLGDEPRRQSVSSGMTFSSPRFNDALESSSHRAEEHEYNLKGLEAKLAEDLSNSRAIDNLLRDVFTGLQETQRKSSAALSIAVPHISQCLKDSISTLRELEDNLPDTRRQVARIRDVYDHGREKAQDLVAALEWLNTPVPLRLRAIIFTPHAPVSTNWKILVRSLFALVFLACLWITYITFTGAIRAHRSGLIWGPGLLS